MTFVPLEAKHAAEWANLIFHVLAHVPPRGNLAASLYDLAYTEWVVKYLGPAAERPLATDVAALARLCPDQASLARLSWLALLFDSLSQARRCQPAALSQILPAQVRNETALATLRDDPASELLWCSALLELSSWLQLPVPKSSLAGLSEALLRLAGAAPHLRRVEVACSPALRLRGRASQERVWVGLPNEEYGPSVAHAAWQAAHEATVLEVFEQSLRQRLTLNHDDTEHLALLLLQSRAERTCLGGEHAHWLTHLSGLPELERSALNAVARPVFEYLVR